MFSTLIKNAALEYSKALVRLHKTKELKTANFILHANEIAQEDWLVHNITERGLYVDRFKELLAVRNLPVLYVAEIANGVSPDIIKNAVVAYKDRADKRASPAFSNSAFNDPNNKTLYIGKVKNNFHGRIIQHMGYFTNEETQGLQLAHWAPSINLDVKFTYYCFETEMANLMSSLEYQLASELKPLLGKHK